MQESKTGPVEVDNGSGSLAPDPTPEKDLSSILPGRGKPVKPKQVRFFGSLFGTDRGYLFVWLIERTTGQHGHAIGRHPDWLLTALDGIEHYTGTHDIYFCAQLLNSPTYRVIGPDGKMHGPRVKANVVEKLAFLWADLDICHPDKLKVAPSIVVESSPGRWQAYWLLAEPIDKYGAENIAHRIAYWHKDDGCDQSGWDLTQLLRVPGTPNYKYDDKPTVEVVEWSERRYRPEDFTGYRELPESEPGEANDEVLELPNFEPLPNPNNKYFWSFFDQVRGESPNPGARGPNGEDRSRSGRTHWFEQRCAEIGLEPGQIRTAAHQFVPAKDKDSDEPGWIDRDFRNWLRDEWPKFKDAKFTQDVEERAYILRVNEAAKEIVTDEQETASFDPPTTVGLTLGEDLADAGTDDRPFTI
jgi:hypothetical protein